MSGSLRALQRDVLGDLVGLREREAAERAFDFGRPPEGGVEGRWHVYASGYVARLVEALEADYPAVRRIRGEEPFAALAERYVRAFPPSSYDLGRAGDLLPEHLTVDPLAAHLPFLSDLARLERAVSEAFVAPDAGTLSWEDLAAEEPDTVAALPLVLAPGTQLVPSRWPVVSLWETRTRPDDAVAVELERNPETALVFRRGHAVACARLGPAEFAFAAAVSDGGRTLSMLERSLAPEGAAGALAPFLAAFRSLVERGVFSQPRTSGIPASEI